MKTKAVLTVLSAFVLMLILGSIYAWSIYVPFLKSEFGFSSLQTQFIFGSVIGIFSTAMIFVNPYIVKFGTRKTLIIGSVIYTAGYVITLFSEGNFWLIWFGVGVLGGIATGIGYLVSVSVPVLWFPQKKGLITGIASAGFGGGAIMQSYVVEKLLAMKFQLLQIMAYPALVYAAVILLIAFLISAPPHFKHADLKSIKIFTIMKDVNFIRLFIGILTGTFAGLMIIGNLKSIGLVHISNEMVLATGIAVFSVANFSGRLFWGWLADHIGAFLLMPLSLFITGGSVYLITNVALNAVSYYLLAFAVGFSFGAHLVLYARETAHRFGLDKLAKIYPYVFLGYGLSGILGPATGGFLSDITGNYLLPAKVAIWLCLIVATAMVVEYILNRIANKVRN